MVIFPYNSNDFAFTLNDVFIHFYTTLESTFFTLKLTVNFYDFGSETKQTKEINYKIPLFNKSQTFNIGRIVHRIMSSVKEFSSAEIQYKTVIVSVVAKETKIDDASVVDTISLNNIKFIAGYFPEILNNNIALLNANKHPARITSQGLINISFLIPSGNHTLEIFKNNELQTSEIIKGTEINNVFTKQFKASDLGAVKGDFFTFKIKDTLIKKDVLIFPNGEYSKVLFFENNFKLIETFECTGEYSFSEKYERITSKRKRNLVEVEEVINTTEIQNFKINTGWVLKSDNITINKINKSKKLWLYVGGIKLIEMIPVSKKLIRFDSKKELYDFSLEFKINKNSDAQNYSF